MDVYLNMKVYVFGFQERNVGGDLVIPPANIFGLTPKPVVDSLNRTENFGVIEKADGRLMVTYFLTKVSRDSYEKLCEKGLVDESTIRTGASNSKLEAIE